MQAKQLWRFLPPKLAHDLLPLALQFTSIFWAEQKSSWKKFSWNGLHFRNRLGIAGGVDKNGLHLREWQHLGAGFLEVGTVTPLPQNPNSGKILDRDWQNKNLWNKMGFPNHGAEDIYFNVSHAKQDLQIPVFLNIGKNRITPNEEAHRDYFFLTEKFADLVDALVINVSSPNTQGLRDLQSENFLKKLVSGVVERSLNKPVLLKLSPDLNEEDLRSSVNAALECGVKGFILTNTTLSRPVDCPFPKEGGLSGRDLKPLSEQKLEKLLQILGPRRQGLLLVSCGGVSDSSDVKKRLEMGADLVQVYSGIVFYGLDLFGQIAKDLRGI